MGIVSNLQRLLAGDEEPTDVEAYSDAKTTIEDPEATSLRAIKLTNEEQDALDADEREP